MSRAIFHSFLIVVRKARIGAQPINGALALMDTLEEARMHAKYKLFSLLFRCVCEEVKKSFVFMTLDHLQTQPRGLHHSTKYRQKFGRVQVIMVLQLGKISFQFMSPGVSVGPVSPFYLYLSQFWTFLKRKSLNYFERFTIKTLARYFFAKKSYIFEWNLV